MSNRTNLSLFNAYIQIYKTCADRLGIKQNGLSTYMNRLVEMRFAPGRSEILLRLVKNRNCRNTIAYESGAMMDASDVTKADCS